MTMDLRRAFDNPWLFELSQRAIPFTVWVYEDLARRHAQFGATDRLLDIGCGVGWHRRLFRLQHYTGIDINPSYVTRATSIYGRLFHVMDASRLGFRDEVFDGAICIATLHHIADDLVRAMIGEALRVINRRGALHIIEPVLPLDPGARLKRFVFENDRGRFQRTLQQLTALVSGAGAIAGHDVQRGVLHDVAYFRVQRRVDCVVGGETLSE
jgi:SAM-dependent methyltransferase